MVQRHGSLTWLDVKQVLVLQHISQGRLQGLRRVSEGA